ncbi:unnamed protein product [Rotaria sordida]|uniref:ABC transporter domain-containing protein n=1 Tax=Rotaria sordida TaxID=392033 RepID=A0A815Q6S5_9BILA|nr:unnamed protein product [Rotaria sordida]CAF4022751.1 unnamed protein product [Rotaria sordida]
MRFIYWRSSSEWSLFNIMFDIIIKLKTLDFIKWFLLTTMSMTLTTYLNVCFFTTITNNVEQGLKYLLLLIIFETITSYCSMKQRLAKRIFVLDFLEEFRSKLYQRILSSDWMKIKLSDQENIRQKLERACSSVQFLFEDILDQLKEMNRFFLTMMTVFYICPMACLLIGMIYFSSYYLYLNKQSENLLHIKTKLIEKRNKLYSKYFRVNENMFEYVIHHDKNKIIQITNQLKNDMERQMFTYNHLYDYLSLKEDIIGKLSTFLILTIFYALYRTNIYLIPLYNSLSKLTNIVQKLIMAYIRWIKFKKDFDLIKPILEEYQERINVEQIDLIYQFQIENLSFEYKDKRGDFHLHHNHCLTFKKGQTILIKGKSGAGKSTFYDILNGSISINNYSGQIHIDNEEKSSQTLHSIEKCRTMVLQDAKMDYRSTIYSMITDIDEDDINQEKNPEIDSLIWKIIHLVQIEDFIKNDLKGDLYQPMENKLSGGQKTRLLLARALYRAYHRNSSILILDEPDKGDENINNRRLSIYLNGQRRLSTLSQIFLPHRERYHAQEHLPPTSPESHQSFVLMTVEDDRNGEGERRLSIICRL